MKNKSPITTFWFIQDGPRSIQTTKEGFDKAIKEGKSIRYNGYANRKMEKIGEALEKSRMAFLNNPDTPAKFKQVLMNPQNVVEVQIIAVDDPEFWIKESKLPKYQ
jgi:hypothetical protein